MVDIGKNGILKGFILEAGQGTGIGIDFLEKKMDINLIFFFSTALFVIGFIGVMVTSSSLIIALMSLEIMLVGLSIDFLVISYYSLDSCGFIFAIAILTLAAAESAIALAIFINIYKVVKTLDIKKISKLSG